MPVFQYAGYDAKGRASKGVIEADTARSAKQRLRGQGVFVKEIAETQAEPQQKITKVPIRQLFQGVGRQEVVVMTRQLATLIAAHIPLVSSLAALAEQTEGLKLKTVLSQVKDDVNEGASLAAALRQHPKVFPNLYTNMIQAGEASGALDTVLLRLADFLETQDELVGKVRNAMIYPIAIVCVATGIVFFLMTSVIPKILTIFDAQRKALPLPTRLLQATSHIVAEWWWIVLAAIAGVVVLIRRYLATPQGRARWDEMKLQIPLFGMIARKFAVARFSRTLATLLSAGIPLLQAMDITKTVVDNTVLQKAIEAARESVSEGSSLSAPLKQSGVFPPMVTHMISVGESSGELEPMLVRVANSYEQEVTGLLSNLTTLLQPMIIVVLGGIIGFIIISVLLPIMQLSQGLK